MRASSLVHLSRRASVLMLLLCMATFTYAQITPSADAYTRSTSSKANYGADTVLHVNGATDTTFIQFNLASIPSGAVVSQASLKLFVDSVTTPGSFNVNYVAGPWSEGTVTYELAPAIGATIASNVAITIEDKNQYILVNMTSAVQAWLNGSEPNHGIALVANGVFQAGFDSKENALTAHPPQLDIVFAAGSSLQLGDNNLICVGSPLAASGASLPGETLSGTSPLNIGIHCSPGGGGGGAGSVTSVGLTAPSTDFIVTGSPVTTSGTLGLGWLTAPDYNNTPNAIVKRDSTGSFSAGTINAVTAFNFAGNPFAFGSYANTSAYLGFAGNTTNTGYANTAVGYLAMTSDTTGWGNSAIGTTALTSNTTGEGNIAMGGLSLYSNVSGSWNTATGGRALYYATSSDNTANGHDALYFTNTGGNNTAVGAEAMFYNTTGSNNTALGYHAAYDQTYTGLTNATAIGANSDVTQSNSLVLGSIAGVNGATASTNVGIGTTAPQYTLDVHGTGSFTGLVTFAPGQTFPGSGGTITGVTAGTGLTGGGTSGTVTLNNTGILGVATGTGISSTGGQNPIIGINTSVVPQLNAANTFSANQTVNGNLIISGTGNGVTFPDGTKLSGTPLPVSVVNGSSAPVPTTDGNVGYAPIWLYAIQVSNSVNNLAAIQEGSSGAYTVPSGYRLVINNISVSCQAQTGSQVNLELIVSGPWQFPFFPVLTKVSTFNGADTFAWNSTAPVYMDQGAQILLNFSTSGTPTLAQVVSFFQGYLVNLN